MKTFTATLVAPDRSTEEYTVQAANKREARAKIGNLYRRDVPRNAAAHGFYSFSQHRLEWAREAE